MAKYEVFDGKHFLPYQYTKAIAVEMARKQAEFYARKAQVWRHTASGLVLDCEVVA